MLDAAQLEFRAAVLSGLSQPQKVVPARYFYDRRGSELFEQITGVSEYYLTRAEVALLHRYGAEIARVAGLGRAVVELGSGSSTKTPLLLRHVAARLYVPVDISTEFLAESSASLAAAHPELEVRPLNADFTKPLTLPLDIANQPMLGFFPGSTIGNVSPAQAVDLLRRLLQTLGPDAALVLGIDTRKDPRPLHAAYNDAGGVTAAFNLNLLVRINRELEGSIPVDAFYHSARWSDALGRIEMHLVASRDVSFNVAGHAFEVAHGETIHTENSHKYSLPEMKLLARASGWEPTAAWTDEEKLFSVHVWHAAPRTLEP